MKIYISTIAVLINFNINIELVYTVSVIVMAEESQLVLPIREISARRSIFHVKKPSKKTWIFVALIFFASYGIWYLIIRFLKFPDYTPKSSDYTILAIILVSVSILSPIIAIFLWNWLGKIVTQKLVYQTLKIKNQEEHEIKAIFRKIKKEQHFKKYRFFRVFVTSLFNLNIDPDTTYYLEEETYDLDVSKISFFIRKRLRDMITSSLGISFLIASIVKFSIRSTYTGFLAGSIVILMSPVLISWVTPVFWIIRDSRIRFIRTENDVYDLSDRFRTSIISRLFSVSVILAGVSFFIDIVQLATGKFDPSLIASIFMYLGAFAFILIVIILISGISFAVGMIYLTTYHEKNVNKLRDELSEFIKFSQTNAVISRYYFM